MTTFDRTRFALSAALVAAGVMFAASGAAAYDGTNCKAPGNCWEPKPGYPAQVKGSKYDPKHSETEINKQSQSIAAMEERNQKRVEYFQLTGEFIYDVKKIPTKASNN